jgi:hypothetical protein
VAMAERTWRRAPRCLSVVPAGAQRSSASRNLDGPLLGREAAREAEQMRQVEHRVVLRQDLAHEEAAVAPPPRARWGSRARASRSRSLLCPVVSGPPRTRRRSRPRSGVRAASARTGSPAVCSHSDTIQTTDACARLIWVAMTQTMKRGAMPQCLGLTCHIRERCSKMNDSTPQM